MAKCDLLIIVPLPEEVRVFAEVFPLGQYKEHEDQYYYPVEMPNLPLNVYTVMAGDMGQTTAGATTEKAVAYLQPKLIVLIGLAGGLDKDLRLGDIVVAKEVSEVLQAAKAVDSGDNAYHIKLAGTHSQISFRFHNASTNFEFAEPALYRAWQEKVKGFRSQLTIPEPGDDMVGEYPTLHVVPIASSELVGASKAHTAALHQHNRKLAALEMEAGGVLRAARMRSKPIEVVVIRGISDFADERKSKFDHETKGAWRRYAVYSAAIFLMQFLQMNVFRKEFGFDNNNDSNYRSTLNSDDNLQTLAQLLSDSGLADLKERRSLCLSIKVNPRTLPWIDGSTEAFSIELISHLHQTGNLSSLQALCSRLNKILHGHKREKLDIICSGLDKV